MISITQCGVASSALSNKYGVKRTTVVTKCSSSSKNSTIIVTDRAIKHLRRIKQDKNKPDLLLRVGVRKGGCSGLSYKMDFETNENVQEDDSVIVADQNPNQNDIKVVVDPKSLLYLYGMRLDYDDSLMSGGFKFQNPNASKSCGCGKSFNV
uniref:Core domain-containing protein n=1 Tax=Polytomella parva TaxID=51329 RepID=A0A7S0YNZ1_9CHLO|mmetsp:Transcript_30457/g.55601  ORF Transcript_30457/g.55601 Transcript_30457/m.55601 type:complete len:152 (+) Transcript_30457:233-688(+)